MKILDFLRFFIKITLHISSQFLNLVLPFIQEESVFVPVTEDNALMEVRGYLMEIIALDRFQG